MCNKRHERILVKFHSACRKCVLKINAWALSLHIWLPLSCDEIRKDRMRNLSLFLRYVWNCRFIYLSFISPWKIHGKHSRSANCSHGTRIFANLGFSDSRWIRRSSQFPVSVVTTWGNKIVSAIYLRLKWNHLVKNAPGIMISNLLLTFIDKIALWRKMDFSCKEKLSLKSEERKLNIKSRLRQKSHFNFYCLNLMFNKSF